MEKSAEMPTIYLLSNMLKLITVKLDQHNYILWFFQMENFLQSLDLMGYIDGTYSSPPKFLVTDEGITAEVTCEFKEWNKVDKAVLSFICATVSAEALAYLVGSRSSREVWVNLRNRYSAVSRFDVMHLKTTLYTVQKNDDSIDKYLQRIKYTRDELAFVDVHYTDEDIIALALDGLPCEYNNIKVVTRSMDKSISMQKLRSLLLSTERDFETQMMLHTSSSPMSVMAAHTEQSAQISIESVSGMGNYHSTFSNNNNQNANLSSNGKYTNKGNKIFGHTKRRDNGRKNFGNNVSNGCGTGNNIIPECQICKKKGHTAISCWYRTDIPHDHPSYSVIICQFCGLKGHAASNCHRRSKCAFEVAEPFFTLHAMSSSSTGSSSISFASCSSLVTHIDIPPAVADAGEQNVIDNGQVDTRFTCEKCTEEVLTEKQFVVDGINDVGALIHAHVPSDVIDKSVSVNGEFSVGDQHNRHEGGHTAPIVQFGDASMALVFTVKRASVDPNTDIICQGRSTLVTILQMCMATTYVLSVMYLNGVRLSDIQAIINGVFTAALFLFISHARLLKHTRHGLDDSKVTQIQNVFVLSSEAYILFYTREKCEVVLSVRDVVDGLLEDIDGSKHDAGCFKEITVGTAVIIVSTSMGGSKYSAGTSHNNETVENICSTYYPGSNGVFIRPEKYAKNIIHGECMIAARPCATLSLQQVQIIKDDGTLLFVHISISIFTLSEKVYRNGLLLQYDPTVEHTADILTKGLHSPVYKGHVINLSVLHPAEIEGRC